MKYDSMVIYRTWMETLDDLDNETAGEVIKMIMHYGMNGEDISDEMTPAARAIFRLMKPILDDDIVSRIRKRNTPQYRIFRKSVLKRDRGICQRCGASEKVMHVHHIKAYKDYPEERTNVDNGITLCPKCHRRLHSEKR